ncbi:MAG: hypothetical protein K8T90_18500 [Planctomycetes bacterium]|nr:hypothetical protein [Planctomycetota bacterium]
MTETAPPSALICPCGAPAPHPLPAPGRAPAPCPRCSTPLVQPGRVSSHTLEVGLAAGVVTAAVCDLAWMCVVKGWVPLAGAWTWAGLPWSETSGSPWFIPLAAIAIASAVRLAARARSPGLQWMALLAFAVFVCAGEVLLYRTTLPGRLVAMHAAEGATDPEILGAEEIAGMDFWAYLHIELEFAWWGAVALGSALAWRMPKAADAVAAFPDPARVPDPVRVTT